MNNNGILVSVIMSVYNSEKYVEESVRSIMKQSYSNLEVLIADDCSTDNSYEILLKLANEDSRIKIIKNEHNLKLAKTLNKLIKLAKGKYIARMDSDDIALPERIEKQVYFLENNYDIDFCGTNAFWINEKNKKIGKSYLPITSFDCKYYFRFGNTFIHPSILIKSFVLKEDLYSESFRYAQDYELWGRLLFKKNKNGANLTERLMLYRICNTQASFSHREEQSSLASSVLDMYEIMGKANLDLHKRLFFQHKWTDLSFSILKMNLQYVHKNICAYSRIVYMNLLKMTLRKKNPFFILYCLLHYPFRLHE